MFGEVILFPFPFTSGTGSKSRPALVLFDLDRNDALLARITTRIPISSKDVALPDWAAAGLFKPSLVRLDRLITAERSSFVRTLGRLTQSDLDRVRDAWNLHMRL